MDVPSSSSSRPAPEGFSSSSQTSSSFLATVRSRLGGSSFALPSLLDGDEKDEDRQPATTRPQSEESDEGEDDDLEDLMMDAQKALISHDTLLAVSLYTKALLLPPSIPSPAAALALGNLLSRGPEDRATLPAPGTKASKMKKRREWEAMNRAGGAYLLGLAGELERAGIFARKQCVNGVGSRSSQSAGDVDENEEVDWVEAGVVEPTAAQSAALENAHELASHLLSLYRRGLVHPTDPTVPLPVPSPHHPLLTHLSVEGEDPATTNVWHLGEHLAREALSMDWKIEEPAGMVSPGSAQRAYSRSVGLKRCLKMHMHYLLALTSHAAFPNESLENFSALLELGPSGFKEANELLSSARERVVSLEKRIASLGQPSKPPSPTFTPYSPLTSTGRRKKTSRTPATPFAISPLSTPTSKDGLPSFPFPRQLPASVPSTAVSPALATTQTSLPFPPSSSNNLPTTSTSSASHLRTYSRSPSLMSLQPQANDQSFPFRARRVSTFSINSGASLSPSMLSLRLSGSRSSVVEGTIDESVVAEGAVLKVLPEKGGSWVGSWFGGRAKKSVAEGSLRRLAVSSTLRAGISEDGEGGRRAESNGIANGKGKGRERTNLQSVFDPPSSSEDLTSTAKQPSTSKRPSPPSTSSSTRAFGPRPSSPLPPAHSSSQVPDHTSSSPTTPIESQPPSPPSAPSPAPSFNATSSHPSPRASTITKPFSLLSPTPPKPKLKPYAFASQPTSPKPSRSHLSTLRSAPSNPHLSRFGDQTLDPQLRQLEMDSIITKGVSCSVCAREGVNLPACPRCGVRFCSRECRVGELGAGDGKKHVCGLLEKRQVSSAAAAAKNRESSSTAIVSPELVASKEIVV